MLSKIVRKSVLKSTKLIIAIFLLFMISQMLLVVSKTTYTNLRTSVHEFYDITNIEDFRIYEIELAKEQYDKEWQEDLEKKFDVVLEPKQYMHIKKEETSYNILRYNDGDTLNTIDIMDGTLPKEEGEILLTYSYMQRNDLHVGDEYELDGNTYTISGSGYIPDFIYPIDLLTGDMAIANDTFIPLYMNSETYDTLPQNQNITYFSGKFKNRDIDKKEEYKKIRDEYTYNVPMLDESGKPQKDNNGAIITKSIQLVPIILDVENNWGFTAIEKELDAQESMLSVLSVVILIITTAIMIVLFNNIFDSQKKEMGILKAEGISAKELAIRYTGYLFITLAVATIPALYLGNLLRLFFTSFILTLYTFPVDQTYNAFLIPALFWTISIIVFVIVVVYFLSIRRKLAKTPIFLLKNIDFEKPPKFKFIRLTEGMSFINKYKVNILLRNVKITLLLIFGVFISSFLLIMGGSIHSSFNKALDTSSKEYYTYDYMAVYSDGKQDEIYDENSMIVKTATIEDINTNTIITPISSTLKVVGYNFDDNDYINILDEQGEELTGDKIYITSLVQKIYDLKVGDYIKITNPYDGTKSLTLQVGGIADIASNTNVYMDISLAQQLFDLDSSYANAEVGVGDKEKELLKYDSDISYSSITDSEDNINTSKQLINVMIVMISIIAIIISVITLAIITSIIISKNKKTISIMKVLGYTNKEINSMITSPYKWILIIVYFASIPLFKLVIQEIINLALQDVNLVVKIKIPFSATWIGFLAIFIIYLISMLITRRNINKVTLAESLKLDE